MELKRIMEFPFNAHRSHLQPTSVATLYFFSTTPVSQSIRQTDSPPHVATVLEQLTMGSERWKEKVRSSQVTREDCPRPGALPDSCFQRQNMYTNLFLTTEITAWWSWGSNTWVLLGFQSQGVQGILQTSLRAHLSWVHSPAMARRHRTRAAF